MVAITQTPANIAWVSGVPPQAVEAGGTFAEGKPLEGPYPYARKIYEADAPGQA